VSSCFDSPLHFCCTVSSKPPISPFPSPVPEVIVGSVFGRRHSLSTPLRLIPCSLTLICCFSPVLFTPLGDFLTEAPCCYPFALRFPPNFFSLCFFTSHSVLRFAKLVSQVTLHLFFASSPVLFNDKNVYCSVGHRAVFADFLRFLTWSSFFGDNLFRRLSGFPSPFTSWTAWVFIMQRLFFRDNGPFFSYHGESFFFVC